MSRIKIKDLAKEEKISVGALRKVIRGASITPGMNYFPGLHWSMKNADPKNIREIFAIRNMSGNYSYDLTGSILEK